MIKLLNKVYGGLLVASLLLAACAPVATPAAQSDASGATQNGYPVTVKVAVGAKRPTPKPPNGW